MQGTVSKIRRAAGRAAHRRNPYNCAKKFWNAPTSEDGHHMMFEIKISNELPTTTVGQLSKTVIAIRA